VTDENPDAALAAVAHAPPVVSGSPGPHNYASLGERFLGKLIDCRHDDLAKTRVIKFPASSHL
jgi:hypothetical protein